MAQSGKRERESTGDDREDDQDWVGGEGDWHDEMTRPTQADR